jgi:hypothetical protein
MMKARTPRAIYAKARASVKQSLENECAAFFIIIILSPFKISLGVHLRRIALLRMN